MRNAVLCLVVLAVLAGLAQAGAGPAPVPPAQAAAAPAAPAQAAPAAPTGRKKRVAIFDFDYATVHSSVAALFGQDVDVALPTPSNIVLGLFIAANARGQRRYLLKTEHRRNLSQRHCG